MRYTCVILLLCLVLTTLLCACAPPAREYDEAQVLTAARELLKRSVPLNDLFWGEGLSPWMAEDAAVQGNYREVSPADMQTFGVRNIDDIRQKTFEVFTQDYGTEILSTKISSVNTGSGVASLARYAQSYTDEGDYDTLYVLTTATVYLTDTVVYDYESMRVSGADSERVFVTLSATVTDAEGHSQTAELTLSLLEEEAGWRLDAPTYLRYNPYREEYEKLQHPETAS